MYTPPVGCCSYASPWALTGKQKFQIIVQYVCNRKVSDGSRGRDGIIVMLPKQAHLFTAGLVLSDSSTPSSEPLLAARHAAAVAASWRLPCAMWSSFSISCSFSVSEAISFRPRVISIFSIFDSISTSLLISVTAALESASMMETSCVWKEKAVDMFGRFVLKREQTSRCLREAF